MDVAVLPYLSQISEDQDVTVRTRAVQLLLDLAQSCDSSKCTDLLNIIEKVQEIDFSVMYICDCECECECECE